jgi:putative phosphoserine phosphatase / 1-acylglycerol-3-phosphate O-acyltransferase
VGMATSRPAVFFDLDRTLLAGASGPVFADAMRAAGLVGPEIPGERIVFGLFDAIGETLPAMVLARQAVSLAKGRPVATVAEVAEVAAATLVGLVQPFAGPLIAEHRAAGRPVVLATTTPEHLVRPFAERLGLDDVVATRYEVAADGTYTGALDGPFVWSRGKLAAVRAWSGANGVDVGASWAYSDSFYDAPLLGAVAHPHAVNPDPRLLLLAAARRWPILHLDVPAGVAKVPVVGLELQRLLLQFARPSFFPYARFDIDGIDNIPQVGPALIVANHRSYFDVAAMAVAIARSGRPVRFLGKKEVFDAPIVGQIASALGGIRVDRGTGSDEPLREAANALEAGELVAMMPQGTIPRGRAFFEPKLVGRWGAARLAALARVPVVPVGLWGTEQVWPRSSRVPFVWNVADPATVTVRVGERVDLKYRSADADTKRIMRAIEGLLPAESRLRREPTADEIAATLPPGADATAAEAEHEHSRRPGTD